MRKLLILFISITGLVHAEVNLLIRQQHAWPNEMKLPIHQAITEEMEAVLEKEMNVPEKESNPLPSVVVDVLLRQENETTHQWSLVARARLEGKQPTPIVVIGVKYCITLVEVLNFIKTSIPEHTTELQNLVAAAQGK